MLRLDYIVPVNSINGQRDKEGAYMVPRQDIGSWVKIVDKLMNDRSEYERLPTTVRNKTVQWLRDMNEAALGNCLSNMAVDLNGHRTDV